MTVASDFNAKITVGDANLDRLDSAVNDTAGVWTTKTGAVVDNLRKRLDAVGYYVPVAFASGLTVTDARFTVTYLGVTYAADPGSVPFTTTGTFEASEWRLVNIDNLQWYDDRNALNAADAAALPQGTKVEMGGHEYTVETGGVAADDLGVSGLSSGFIGKNRWVLNAEAWGVTPDDPTADTANGTILRAMSLHLIENRQKGEIVMPRGGKVYANRPVIFGPDGTTLNMRGAWLHNPRTSYLTGDGDLSDACFTVGAMSIRDFDDGNEAGVVKAGAVVRGANTITVTNPADFEIGDVIHVINANTKLGLPVYSGPDPVPSGFARAPGEPPINTNITVVTGKTGSVLDVRDPWSFDGDAGSGTYGNEDTAGVWISNFDYRVNSANTAAGAITLECGRWAARNPVILGGIFSNSLGNINARSIYIDGHYERLEFQRSAYGFLVNGAVQSHIKDCRFDFDLRAFEMKFGSRGSVLRDCHFSFYDTGATRETAFSFGEAAEDCRVVGGEFNLGDSGNNSVFNWGGTNYDCTVEGVTVRSASGSLASAILMGDATSIRAKAIGNTFIAGDYSDFPIIMEGTDCEVRDNLFYGSLAGADGAGRIRADAVGGAITGNRFEGEGHIEVIAGVTGKPRVRDNDGVTHIEGEPRLVSAQNNDGPEWQSLADFNEDQSLGSEGTTVTTLATVGTPMTAPAGTLRIGDMIEIVVSGSKTPAATGTLEIEITDSATLNPFTWAVPAGAGEFEYRLWVRITSASRYAYKVVASDLGNNTVDGANATKLGGTFGVDDLVFTTKASVASGSMVIRQITATRKRAGMVE